MGSVLAPMREILQENESDPGWTRQNTGVDKEGVDEGWGACLHYAMRELLQQIKANEGGRVKRRGGQGRGWRGVGSAFASMCEILQ